MQRGQVLLLTTLILGAMITSAYLFVGYLATKKLRQSILVVDSAQAFYASDSGIEAELYRILKGGSLQCRFINENVGFKVSSCAEGFVENSTFGLVIKSTGQAYKVTRSQKDFSQTISSSTKSMAGLPFCSISSLIQSCPLNLKSIY
ncbi:hypothetical protein HZC33_02975 [Candidatus Wolfebacteria bacterium]|nr:hypothetical protein [Candidatus Wolfebacteria bacterium]